MKYENLMHISVVTEKFQKISKEIIEIKETLAKDHPDTKLSQMVERVQVIGYCSEFIYILHTFI